MYRCKIFSILLSLAIIASLFSVSVSAESLPFFQIVWSYSTDGNNWTQIAADASDGCVFSFTNNDYYWRIDGFRFYLGHTENTEFLISFTVNGVLFGDYVHNYPYRLQAQNYSGQKKGVVYTSTASNANISDRASFFVYGQRGNQDVPLGSEFYSVDGNNSYSDLIPGQNCYSFYVRLTSHYSTDNNAQVYFALNAPPVFNFQGHNGSSYYNMPFVPYLTNTTYYDNLNVLLTNLFAGVNTNLGTINYSIYSMDLHNQAWYSYWTSPYYYPIVNYNNNTSAETSGNFWDAINGHLKVITDKITHQMTLSNQYGQMDGFEAGMSDIEHAGGIDVITDFNSIINVSPWNASSYGTQSYNGILHWFSSENHIAIQPVQRYRNDDGFIDYTDQMYQDYINALNPSRLIFSGEEDEDDGAAID